MQNTEPSLNPALKQFWLMPARNRVLYGGRSSSKCLAVGTKIVMSDFSLKNVEDITVGDYVMGPDSLPRKVLSTTRGTSKMYLVSQSHGEDYVVNEDHILSLKKNPLVKNDKGELLSSGNRRRGNGRYSNDPDVVNISVKDFIKKTDRWKCHFRGYRAGVIDFNNCQDVPLDPYFIGLWLGDGLYREPLITTADEEIVDYLNDFAEKNSCKTSIIQSEKSKAVNVTIKKKSGQSNPVWRKMVDLGLGKIQSASCRTYQSMKHIPDVYLKSSIDNRLKLLAGLIDSDGYYSQEKNSMIISQTNERLANDIYRLSLSLGFRATKNITKTKCGKVEGQTFLISICGSIEDIPCLLPRKKAKKGKYKGDVLLSKIEVKDIGMGEYAGFSIDGDHLFLLSDNTVTHNSWDAAGVAVALAHELKIKVLCTRQFQNRITDSVYSLLKIQIERFGLQDDFLILKSSIVHKRTGSEFLFYGLARNTDEIKSTEGVDILWVEEGHALTKAQWEILEPTIRKEGSQVWMIFNPHLASDFAYQRFVVNPPPDTIVRRINWDENPFLSNTMLKIIKAAMDEDFDEYQHIYEGVPRIDDDSVIIKRSWIEAAVNAHERLGFEPEGQKVIGFDVADDGNDKCANIYAHGSVVLWGDEWSGGEDKLLQSCSRTYFSAKERGAKIRYDSIGVGAGCGSKFDELNKVGSDRVQYEKFNAGGAVVRPEDYYVSNKMDRIKNKDFFSNIKAQTWWQVADRFRNTYDAIHNGTKYDVDELISISADMPNIERLKTELSTPKRDFDNNGRVKVESKKDLAKREIASPNLADAFVMCFAPATAHRLNIKSAAIAKALSR